MSNTLAEKLKVELDPARIEIEPGGPSQAAVVTLQNLGDGVEQYSVEVTGLDPQWYEASVTSVGLFPQDKDQVRLTFHPPQSGARPGSYPFRVVVRSSAGDGLEKTVEGVLDVRVRAVYQARLEPVQQTSRLRGAYHLRLANTGAADVRLAAEVHDPDNALNVHLPQDHAPLVPAGKEVDVAITITPKSGRWVGPERTYQFDVAVRPQEASGEPQMIAAQYTHHPWLASWDPVKRGARRAARPVAIGAGVLLLLAFIFLADVPGRIVAGTGAAGHAVGATAARAWSALPLPGRSAAAAPKAARDCKLDQRVSGFTPAEAPLVGDCASRADSDPFGNAIQYTNKGVLYWLKSTDSVYFFAGDSVYVLVDGRFRLLNGSGHR